MAAHGRSRASRLGRLLSLQALALVCWTCLMSSSGAAAADQPNGQRASFDLRLNEQDKGEAFIFLTGADVYVKVADLEQAGLTAFKGKRITIDGDEFVLLCSLAPDVEYKLDQDQLQLSITARSEHFAANTIELGYGHPRGIFYSNDRSAFVNYSVNLNNFNTIDAFWETGLAFGDNLLYSSLAFNDQGQWVRGLTNLTLSDRNNLRTLILGDSVATPLDPLGGGGFLGGVSFSRNFSLDPYFIQFPTQNVSGTLTTPSTVQIYVNGRLVRQEELPPGMFQLNDIPGTQGTSNTEVVIRDAFGNQQQISAPYYVANQVLKQGLSDYSYNLGFARNDLSTSFQYGEPSFLMRHRYGLTDTLTGGMRAEGDRRSISAGPMFDLRLPIGQAEASIAGSDSHSQSGAAASLAYSYLTTTYGVGAALRAMTSQYSNLSLTPQDDRARLQFSSSLSFPLTSRISLALQYAYSKFRDAGLQSQAGASLNIRLVNKLSLFISASDLMQHQAPSNAPQAFVSLSYFFGENSTATVSYNYQKGTGDAEALSLQRPLPLGPGYGYRVEGQTGTSQQFNGTFQYQNPYGYYEADYGHVGSQDISRLNIAGGIAAIGGRLFLTRPIQQGYALLRVPNVENVTGYLDNQVMGKTDSKGDLLIPNLLSYYGNQLGIDAENVPMDYAVDETRKLAAPPYRAGAVVAFPVHRLQAFTGSLEVDAGGKRIVPALGELTVAADGKEYQSPIGNDGEFYFEDVPAGTYQAKIDFKEGECRFSVDLPKSKESFVRMGTVKCVTGAIL